MFGNNGANAIAVLGINYDQIMEWTNEPPLEIYEILITDVDWDY